MATGIDLATSNLLENGTQKLLIQYLLNNSADRLAGERRMGPQPYDRQMEEKETTEQDQVIENDLIEDAVVANEPIEIIQELITLKCNISSSTLTRAVTNLIEGKQKSDSTSEVYNSHMNIIRLLLKAPDFDKEYFTIDYGDSYPDLVSEWLEEGHDSLLTLSIEYNMTDLVRLLLEHRCKLCAADVKLAMKGTNEEILTLLMSYTSFTKKLNLLPYAASHATSRILEMLLEAGADVNKRTKQKENEMLGCSEDDYCCTVLHSALHIASFEGKTENVHILLKHDQ